MAGKVLKTLGAAGMAIVAAIFFFALWLFKKAAKLDGKEMGKEGYEIEGHSFSEEEAEGFRTNFMEDNPTFEEDPIFKDEEAFIANEQPLIEEEEFQENERSELFA